MNFDVERLYNLLPTIFRIRDAQQGGLLRELLTVIAEQVNALEEDLDQLYDDQFIETCAEWVVPYIGDLIGVQGVHKASLHLSQRAQVANTLAYRRRKGTAAVLEQLARDVTGWNAKIVEFFQILATTQYLNHLRMGNHYSPDLRQWEALEYLNTPFDTQAHTADMHCVSSRRGRYNIPNVGIFLWRLHAYSLTKSPAYRLDDRRYLCSPLGINTRLFNRPKPEDDIAHLAEPINLPMPLSRSILNRNPGIYYGSDKSLLITVNGKDIDVNQIVVCNLADKKNGQWAYQPEEKYGIDPILGRLALPENMHVPKTVKVSFHYGFIADLGGGEYERAESFTNLDRMHRVPKPYRSVKNALSTLGADKGIVEITDSGHYEVKRLSIHAAAESQIELRAGDKRRPVLKLDNRELIIYGLEHSQVTLNGLLITGGKVRVPKNHSSGGKNKLQYLRLRHCTLVPGISLFSDGSPQYPDEPLLIVESANTVVEIENCIVGGMRVAKDNRTQIVNSIIDATDMSRTAYAATDGNGAGCTISLKNCTIIGKVHTMLMELASNTIFLSRLAEGDIWTAPVLAEQKQEGCVRFSYVPLNARIPRRYRCQPASEDEAGRVQPQFTSLRYGNAAYCQLIQNCPIEILQGADDEAEMGAFHDLYQPQREINLRVHLDEYLRFGIEAGIFYAT